MSARKANNLTVSSVVAVSLCGVFAFIDLYATQPLLPLLAELFHASKAEVGLTVSASTLGVAMSAPFLGAFTEPSVVTSKAAIRGHSKTGQRDWPKT